MVGTPPEPGIIPGTPSGSTGGSGAGDRSGGRPGPPGDGDAGRAVRRPTITERRPTITDVARRAGVSASTASLTFSGSPRVSQGTRERVLAAAADLGYGGPDPLGRSLRRGRCGVVAVVVGERLGYAFHDPMMVTTLDGLAEEIGALGSSLLLVPVRSSRPGPEPSLGALPMDAAVLLDCDVPAGPLLEVLRARGVAVIGVDGPYSGGVPVVGIDDARGTTDLIDHLTGLGHRRLGVVTLPLALDGTGGPLSDADLSGARTAEGIGVTLRRLRATQAAVAATEGCSARYVEATWNLVAEGEHAAGFLLDAAEPPTALVAQSDVLALGCLRAASARGLDVPGRLSVVGFDGVDLHLVGTTRLTTVVQPGVEKGRIAGRMVAAALRGEPVRDHRLPITLHLGTTTAPCPLS